MHQSDIQRYIAAQHRGQYRLESRPRFSARQLFDVRSNKPWHCARPDLKVFVGAPVSGDTFRSAAMQHLHVLQNNTRGQTARCCLASVFLTALVSTTGSSAVAQTSGAANNACPGDNGGLTFSPGFCATVFADNLGHVRQMVVAPNGVLYANTWSGRYYRNDTPPRADFCLPSKTTKQLVAPM
jgi:hypothetical protein